MGFSNPFSTWMTLVSDSLLPKYFNFFKKKLGFTSCKAEQPLRGMELQEK